MNCLLHILLQDVLLDRAVEFEFDALIPLLRLGFFPTRFLCIPFFFFSFQFPASQSVFMVIIISDFSDFFSNNFFLLFLVLDFIVFLVIFNFFQETVGVLERKFGTDDGGEVPVLVLELLVWETCLFS